MREGFTTQPTVRKAVEIVGSQKRLAERLSEVMGRSIKQQHVWRWLNTVRVIAAEFVIPIELVTDGQVTRHELRPDLYPPDEIHRRKNGESHGVAA